MLLTGCDDLSLKGVLAIWDEMPSVMQLWARYNFIVEYRKPFTIVNPPCDWDAAANDFGEYFGMERIAARNEANKAAGIELTPDQIDRQNNMARVTDEYDMEEAGAGAAGKTAASGDAAAGGASAGAQSGGAGTPET